MALLLLGYLGLAIIMYNNQPAFLEQKRSVSAIPSFFFFDQAVFAYPLLCKTASSTIITLLLQTDEVLKVPGNTEKQHFIIPKPKRVCFSSSAHTAEKDVARICK